jgi:hypothetical protein
LADTASVADSASSVTRLDSFIQLPPRLPLCSGEMFVETCTPNKRCARSVRQCVRAVKTSLLFDPERNRQRRV